MTATAAKRTIEASRSIGGSGAGSDFAGNHKRFKTRTSTQFFVVTRHILGICGRAKPRYPYPLFWLLNAMKSMTWDRVLLVIFFAICPCLLLADSVSEKNVPAGRDLGADHFVAGCPVSVMRPVAGDLMAAGCNVDVLAEVAGDLITMGGNLRIAAPVKQGLYAAGGRISIEAAVQRNVRIAGGKVNLGPNAKVAGNVTIGGGEVEIDGAITGYLQVGAGTVRINGPVAGDVEVGAGRLELGPNARIEGKLRYASDNEVMRDSAAQVRGGMERIERRERWPASRNHWRRARHTFGWAWSIGLLAIAAILLAALPQFYKGITETARTRWAFSLLIGFIVLVCVPVAVLIAIITVIGIPLALVMTGLYLALLLVGYVSAGIVLGDVALQRWRADRTAQQGWRFTAAGDVSAQLAWASSLRRRVGHAGRDADWHRRIADAIAICSGCGKQFWLSLGETVCGSGDTFISHLSDVTVRSKQTEKSHEYE